MAVRETRLSIMLPGHSGKGYDAEAVGGVTAEWVLLGKAVFWVRFIRQVATLAHFSRSGEDNGFRLPFDSPHSISIHGKKNGSISFRCEARVCCEADSAGVAVLSEVRTAGC